MTLTIELTPSEQEKVTAVARLRGLDPVQFIKLLVTAELPGDELQLMGKANHFYFSASREEFNGALDAVAQMNVTAPVLADSAFDRENLYEDRF